jgi:hypothetical protein
LEPIARALVESAGGYEAFSTAVPQLFRNALDEVIDAPRTGRFTLSETEKTEKTYLGTKVEIFLRQFLKLPKGKILDLSVAGVEVDIKNTVGSNWSIPIESIDHPALLVRLNEKRALCDVGLVVVRDAYLNAGSNRDSKRGIAAASASNIWWLLSQHPFPPNFWEVLPPEDRAAILEPKAATQRLAVLFEKIQRMPISRKQVQAVARQLDYMKRLRKNGGARDVLRAKGIALLSGTYHQDVIAKLGLGPISSEEFISVCAKNTREEALLRSKGLLD